LCIVAFDMGDAICGENGFRFGLGWTESWGRSGGFLNSTLGGSGSGCFCIGI
jgi:hypothetical protein